MNLAKTGRVNLPCIPGRYKNLNNGDDKGPLWEKARHLIGCSNSLGENDRISRATEDELQRQYRYDLSWQENRSEMGDGKEAGADSGCGAGTGHMRERTVCRDWDHNRKWNDLVFRLLTKKQWWGTHETLREQDAKGWDNVGITKKCAFLVLRVYLGLCAMSNH